MAARFSDQGPQVSRGADLEVLVGIFEHLSMIPFLLIAMGIIRILEGVGAIIHRQQTSGEDMSLHWSHGVLSVTVLLTMIIFWWNSFNFNQDGLYHKPTWNISEYALYILPCLILFLLADLLVPNNLKQGGKLCLKSYYFRQHREFFLLTTVYALLNYVNSHLFFGQRLDSPYSLCLLSIAAVTLPMVIWKSPRLHAILNVVFLAITVFSATFYWDLGGV